MRVMVSGAMARLVSYQKEIQVEGDTVRAGLDRLMEQYPDLKRVMLDSQGKVRKTHHIFVEGQSVKGDDLERGVRPTDTVQITTAIAGG